MPALTLLCLLLLVQAAPVGSAIEWRGAKVTLSASGSTITFEDTVRVNDVRVGADYVIVDGIKLVVQPVSGSATITVTAWGYDARWWTVSSPAGVTFNLSGLTPDFYRLDVNAVTQKQGKVSSFDWNIGSGSRDITIDTYKPSAGAVPGTISDAAATGAPSPSTPALKPGGGLSGGPVQGGFRFGVIHFLAFAGVVLGGINLFPPAERVLPRKLQWHPIVAGLALATGFLILISIFTK